ncbi:uncharacterized protein LOC133736760 isoform X1 [Rosa rugosa]|uniref:uncharacterized protein LOC133717691 isoform X1 n=2 Tax=Rosa rugosa TaxID=74645 RepID=UPI002B41003B|nr:uncharacterized protein LOC133717691 isoform X1 [Rosa rugosa]XP_062016818.1 uncharacterized protein LOC133733207 isoform X1 [Rosa rugosa]XP_062020341.1 uncharacterized protein LOC133736760 isoform X1 [Rosa rugosa]
MSNGLTLCVIGLCVAILWMQVCRSVKFLVGGASLKVFHEMVSAGVEPNVHTYGALINGCGRAAEVAKAFGAYGILRSKALDKSKYMDGLRAVRKHIQKLEHDLELLKAHAKTKVEFSSNAIEETPEDIESVESGSSSNPNETMRTAKLDTLK